MHRNYSDFYLYLVVTDNMKPTSMYITYYTKHLYSFQLPEPWELDRKTCVFREIIKIAESSTVDSCLVIWLQKDGVYLWEFCSCVLYICKRRTPRQFYQKQKIHKQLFYKLHQYILTVKIKNIKNGRLVKHSIFIQKHSNVISEKVNWQLMTSGNKQLRWTFSARVKKDMFHFERQEKEIFPIHTNEAWITKNCWSIFCIFLLALSKSKNRKAWWNRGLLAIIRGQQIRNHSLTFHSL